MVAISADSTRAASVRFEIAKAVAGWLLAAAVAFPGNTEAAVGAACAEPAHCDQSAGEFCLAGRCRAASDTSVVPLFAVGVAPWYDLTAEPGSVGFAEESAEILRGLFQSTVFFDVLPPQRHPEGAVSEGWQQSTLQFAAWSARGVFGVVKAVVRPSAGPMPLDVEFYWYETETARRLTFPSDRQSVSLSGIKGAMQRWCDEVVRHYTGRPGVLSSRIVYARRTKEAGSAKEIAHTGLDGLDVIQVTNNGSINVLPAWAPRGRVAYTSYQNGAPDIYVDEVLFASHGSLNTGITWRADGKTAAVAMSGDDGNADIYLVDGQNGALLDRLTFAGGIDTSPSFSPDGGRIAFLSDRAGAPQIWVMNADGSNTKNLTPWCGYCTSPDWSPVGSWIVYNAMAGAGRFDLFMVNADTGEVRRLTNGSGSNEDPSFSPDGRYVVFSSTRGSRRGESEKHLWVMSAEGGAARQITRDDLLHFTPSWSRPWDQLPGGPPPAEAQ